MTVYVTLSRASTRGLCIPGIQAQGLGFGAGKYGLRLMVLKCSEISKFVAEVEA